jgi:adenine C2-methylase RlmN of 23S rRNA A2503 and tRNA A37
MEYAELIKKISKLPEYAKKLEEVVEQIKIAVDLVINSAKNITDIASNIAKNIFNFVNYLWKTLSNIVASFLVKEALSMKGLQKLI